MSFASSDTTAYSRTTGRNKRREKTTLDPAGRLEKLLQQIGVDISQTQLRAMLGTEGIGKLLNAQTRDAYSDESLAAEQSRIEGAGKLTDQESGFINDAASSSYRQGASQIDESTTLGLQQLRQELAPSRGLRSSDSPVIDRGSLIARQGMRQKGELGLGLQSQAARARLEFPLQRQAFQDQLRNNAFKNRLSLSGQSSQLGLNLSSLFNPAQFQRNFLDERLGSSFKITRGSGYQNFNSKSHTDNISKGASGGGGGGGGGG